VAAGLRAGPVATGLCAGQAREARLGAPAEGYRRGGVAERWSSATANKAGGVASPARPRPLALERENGPVMMAL
jgi:hypothetical protein